MGWLGRLFGKPSKASEGSLNDASEDRLHTGVVDDRMFAAFSEAHSYDAASSMNYLNARLATLLLVLRRGVSLQLHGPGGDTEAASEGEYRSWAKKYFPNARF